MSLKTWKEEFYPKTAYEVLLEGNYDEREDRAALDHSILKWRGLLPENLRKHGVRVVDTMIAEEGVEVDDYSPSDKAFRINGDTCALCALVRGQGCEACVLAKSRDDIPCDEFTCEIDDEGKSPYHSFADDGDPKPMIDALEKASDYLDENERD